jgi:hypothetical protein
MDAHFKPKDGKTATWSQAFGRMNGAFHRALREDFQTFTGLKQKSQNVDDLPGVKEARQGHEGDLNEYLNSAAVKDKTDSQETQARKLREITDKWTQIAEQQSGKPLAKRSLLEKAVSKSKRRLQNIDTTCAYGQVHSSCDSATGGFWGTNSDNKGDRGWWMDPKSRNACINGFGPHNATFATIFGTDSCKSTVSRLYGGNGYDHPQDPNYWGDAFTQGLDLMSNCRHFTNDPDRNYAVDNDIHRIGIDIFWWAANYQTGYFSENPWGFSKKVKMQIPCHGGGTTWFGGFVDTFMQWEEYTGQQGRISGSPASDGYQWCSDVCDCLGGELVPDYTKRYWGIVFLVCIIISYLMSCVNCAIFVKFYNKSTECDQDWEDVKKWRMIHMPVMAGVIPGVAGTDMMMQQQLMQQQQMLAMQQQQQAQMAMMQQQQMAQPQMGGTSMTGKPKPYGQSKM